MKLLSLMAEALDRGFAVCLKPLENGDYWASFGHVETPRDEWTGFDRSNWHDFCDDLTILIRDTLHPVTDVDPF
jgi:hypothetical protein